MCSLYGLELLYSTNFAELTFITILPVQPYDYLKWDGLLPIARAFKWCSGGYVVHFKWNEGILLNWSVPVRQEGATEGER